jgi:Ca2+/H+ antiporter, TMEM165/GDT1 family
MRRHWILRGIKILVIVLIAATALSFVVMGLWNRLIPAIFGLHAISFWQALGLLVLSKILFGGFRGRHGCSYRGRERMLDRWEQMTPEEREKFRAGLRGRCGPFGSSSSTPAA